MLSVEVMNVSIGIVGILLKELPIDLLEGIRTERFSYCATNKSTQSEMFSSTTHWQTAECPQTGICDEGHSPVCITCANISATSCAISDLLLSCALSN